MEIAAGTPASSLAKVKFEFQFRRYRLPFRMPVRTSRGVWSERAGVLVRLVDEAGGVGYGEAAPIPAFGSESVEEIEAVCRRLGAVIEDQSLENMGEELPCLRHAFWAARQPRLTLTGKYLSVAALLPAGRGATDILKEKADIGFRVFKWKVGVGDAADEMTMLDDLCAALPSGGKLRLDANGAWDRRRAERWLERCAERPVEFVEQPVGGGGRRTDGDVGKEMDLLLGLAGDFPTALALDESITQDHDVEHWLGAGWPGIFVLKLGLHGDVTRALGRLEKQKDRVVFSSGLETVAGARGALRAIFAWQSAKADSSTPPRALGFGVWPLFADPRFDGPAAAPFVRSEDVEQLKVEVAWNALS